MLLYAYMLYILFDSIHSARPGTTMAGQQLYRRYFSNIYVLYFSTETTHYSHHGVWG